MALATKILEELRLCGGELAGPEDLDQLIAGATIAVNNPQQRQISPFTPAVTAPQLFYQEQSHQDVFRKGQVESAQIIPER